MKCKQLHCVIVALLHLATVKANLTVNAICSNAKPWTLVPDKRQCEKFYVCTGRRDNSYQEFKCPTDYHFSKPEQRCVRGPCAPSCNATGSTSVQRLQNECTRYRRCASDGQLALLECSYGHYFDAKRNVCLPVAITPGHQCSCILPEHSMLPNVNDCSSYYRCEEGKALLQQCPKDYYYDRRLNSCLLDTKGVCPRTLSRPEIGMWLPECAGVGSRLLPHRHNCSLYYVCLGSRAIELSCPKGQYFNVLTRYCTADEDVKCYNAQPAPVITVAPVQMQAVIVQRPTKEVINQKQAHEVINSYFASEESSLKPNPDVINNKLASKFIIF